MANPACPTCGLYHEGVCDPGTRYRVESSTSGGDLNRFAVGSAPAQGDVAADGILIPAAPTVPQGGEVPDGTAQQNRYLFRLCGIVVPPGHVCRLVGLRTIVTIGADIVVEDEQFDPPGLSTYHVETPVRTPFWVFQDGNVSLHLRWNAGPTSGSVVTMQFNADRPLAGSTTMGGTFPAILFKPHPSGAATPYQAPNGGQPLGTPVGSLGTWRDVTRFPWNEQGVGDWGKVDFEGPGELTLCGSVFQTDPETRQPQPASLINALAALVFTVPEEAFIAGFADEETGISPIRYYRIAGAMVADVIPWGALCARGYRGP